MKTIEDIRQKWGDRPCLKYLDNNFIDCIREVVECDIYYKIFVNNVEVNIYYMEDVPNQYDQFTVDYDSYLVIETDYIDYTISVDDFDNRLEHILNKLDMIVEGVV